MRRDVPRAAPVGQPPPPTRDTRHPHLEAEARQRRLRVAGQPAAAGLVPGKTRLVEAEDSLCANSLRQRDRDGDAGWPSAGDHHVAHVALTAIDSRAHGCAESAPVTSIVMAPVGTGVPAPITTVAAVMISNGIESMPVKV